MSTQTLSYFFAGFDGGHFIRALYDAGICPVQKFENLTVRGSWFFLNLLAEYKKKHGSEFRNWPLPQGKTPEELVLSEFILKVLGKWHEPYQDTELCHCRKVPTQDVDEAIVFGAHSTSMVSAITGASTACGTCKPNVEILLARRNLSSN